MDNCLWIVHGINEMVPYINNLSFTGALLPCLSFSTRYSGTNGNNYCGVWVCAYVSCQWLYAVVLLHTYMYIQHCVLYKPHHLTCMCSVFQKC